MGKKLLKELDGLLKKAEVEAGDEDIFTVTVKGAVREVTQVKAKDEKEALKKATEVLKEKTTNYPDEPGEIVEIKPTSVGGSKRG